MSMSMDYELLFSAYHMNGCICIRVYMCIEAPHVAVPDMAQMYSMMLQSQQMMQVTSSLQEINSKVRYIRNMKAKIHNY